VGIQAAINSAELAKYCKLCYDKKKFGILQCVCRKLCWNLFKTLKQIRIENDGECSVRNNKLSC
jgi:hypothetical protein